MATATRVSTISMVVADDFLRGDGEPDMQDKFARLVEIEHRVLGSSVMRFGGYEYQTKDYFRKEGFSLSRNRVRTASDGREYEWLLRSMKSEALILATPSFSQLVTNDSEEKTIAKTRRRSLGILGPAGPGCLEIQPEGEHIIQEIFITFIYVEKYRKEKERTSKY
ncbi:hypothetical protein FPV67DRAFT_1422285 [Lyophyllum atratum]|nr:hypothetical protein FPV67DRAFT_1422285 [Lyophyllum atratum]